MSGLNYSHILNFTYSVPWAILPAKLEIIMDLLAFRAQGGSLTAEEIEERIGAVSKPQQRQMGAIAVLPLYGTLIPRGNFLNSSGVTSVEGFTQLFRQAMMDPSVGGIVLDIDSPGGSVAGIGELASEIYQARAVKPVMAVANPMAASAAFWLATAAEELMVIPSGNVGSIGVIATHRDYSGALEKEGIKTTLISAGKYKVEGHPYGALDEVATAAIQERVDDYYETFTSAVAEYRNVPLSDVQNGMGEGRLVSAKKARKLKMVDGMMTLDEAIARMSERMKQRNGTGPRSEGDDLPFEAITLSDSDQEFVEMHEAVVQELCQPVGQMSYVNYLDLRRRRLKLAGK